jgi:hypothetical protein
MTTLFRLAEPVGRQDGRPRPFRGKRSLNLHLIIAYVARLKAAATNRPAVLGVIRDLHDDTRLTTADVVDITLRYKGGGEAPCSKAAALAMINKRFVDIMRGHAEVG